MSTGGLVHVLKKRNVYKVFFVPISRWFWSKQTYFYENVLSKFDSIFSWRIDTRWSSSKKNFFEFQFFFGSKTKFQISLILSVMGDKKWRIPLIEGSHMYRPFHKTLPRSIAFVNWISVLWNWLLFNYDNCLFMKD